MSDTRTIRHQEPDAWVPRELETMTPGPVLDAFLSAVCVDELSADDRIRVLMARQRMVSHHSARLMSELASVVDGYLEDDGVGGVDLDDLHNVESVASEIRAALHLTRTAADTLVIRALEIRSELPQVAALLESGDIDVPRLVAIHRATDGLSPQIRTLVVDAILEDVPHLTTGQIRARIRRLAMEVEPETAELQYVAGVEKRRVEIWANADGTANLAGSNLPPDRVVEIRRRINDIAKSMRGDDESRTMDQLRADVFLDLLSGDSGERIGRGVVDIRVDLDTLAELKESPGDLGGYGPVIADIARKTTEQNWDAEWRFMVTDPDTRQPVAVGTTRRRPTAQQRRVVEMFHTMCVFPGCRMPATESDLDHRIEREVGGPTTVANLIPLCRHDHRIRHQAGWRHWIDEAGDYRWLSPIGRQYSVSSTTRATVTIRDAERSPP